MTRPHHVATAATIAVMSTAAGFYVDTLLGWWCFWARRI